MTINKPAKYLPKMIEISVTGLVVNVSNVPLRFSSLNDRIVMADIKKIKIIGAMEMIIGSNSQVLTFDCE